MTSLDTQSIEHFQADGAVLLPGLFSDWIDEITAGIEHNMREPGPYAAENVGSDDTGRFFDDYCNWQRIPEFRRIVTESRAAEVAGALMRSNRVQFFHDHVLVKEPGTSKPTPWHQDAPYYFVDGRQTVSFWIPIDPVDDATLRVIAGSHTWPKYVLPVRWLREESFYPDTDDYLPVPDPDADPARYRVLEWAMAPGDAIAFDFRAVHGARGNATTRRRRALSLRFIGDDARYAERPGRTSPPFPDHGMRPGERLREDWFPILLSADA